MQGATREPRLSTATDQSPFCQICKRRPAGVLHHDRVADLGRLVIPICVVVVEVEAAMRDVGVALRPDRGLELVQVHAVGADLGRPIYRLLVPELGVHRQAVG